jgi:hypothetical protein
MPFPGRHGVRSHLLDSRSTDRKSRWREVIEINGSSAEISGAFNSRKSAGGSFTPAKVSDNTNLRQIVPYLMLTPYPADQDTKSDLSIVKSTYQRFPLICGD